MTRKAAAKAANSIDGFDHNAIYKEMPPNLKVASSNLAPATTFVITIMAAASPPRPPPMMKIGWGTH